MKKNVRSFAAGSVILASILACNTSGATITPEAAAPATEVVQVVGTAGPPTDAPIAHEIVPVALPENRSSHAGDYDSSVTAEQKKSNGGDRFTFERFERPFNANTMDIYFPELDIIDTFVYQDELWVYGTIQVVDRSAASASPYRFAMQVDNEVDGKGDYLVIAANPPATDWTTNGVQVYFDSNSDVGDLTAMLTDENSTSDGFEILIFDQGKGDDADAAWVRISPNDSNTVEIAVKRAVVGNPARYLVDMWAGHGSLEASLFDYSDHFTHDQAGAADPGFPNFYPIKALYEIDNSCRMAVGFEPTGYEPGLCPALAPDKPVAQPGGCTASTRQIIACTFGNGTWDPNTCTCTLPTAIPPPK